MIYFGITIGVMLFLIQQYNIKENYKKLKKNNMDLIQNDIKHSIDILKIINANLTPNFVIADTEFVADKMFLCVDYPICASCFVDVNHFLHSYAKKNGKKLILLCRTKYIQQVRKVLKFENLEQIEVNALIDMDNSIAKMIVVFNTSENKQFYLPLPEHREMDFLETFLK